MWNKNSLTRQVLIEKSNIHIKRVQIINYQIEGQDRFGIWWYSDKVNYVYDVKNISNREELENISGMEDYRLSEMYIVVAGMRSPSVILKKHCKIIEQ